MNRHQLLDLYYLEARAKLIELAAFLDRLDRAEGEAALTLFLQRVVKRDAQYWDVSAARRKSAKVFAVVSLLLWVSILAAGRWIAYVQHG